MTFFCPSMQALVSLWSTAPSIVNIMNSERIRNDVYSGIMKPAVTSTSLLSKASIPASYKPLPLTSTMMSYSPSVGGSLHTTVGERLPLESERIEVGCPQFVRE